MIRSILGLIVGFIAGGVAVFLFEWIGHQVYPIPPGLDTSDMKALAEYSKTAPVGAHAAILVAQCAGSLVGGFVTALIAVSARTLFVFIYGVLALLMALLNIYLLPHPVWFVVAAIILPIPLALAGGKIGGALGSQPAA